MGSPDFSKSSASDDAVLPRPRRLVRRLLWVYGTALVAAALVLAAGLLAGGYLPRFAALTREVAASGLGAVALPSLLLAVTALLATWLLTSARAGIRRTDGRAAALPPWRVWLTSPGTAARQGQAIVIPAGAVLTWLITRELFPAARHLEAASSGNLAAAFVVGLAFVSLMAERVVNDFPAPQLPEAPALRRLLLLVTVLLTLGAALQFGDSAGLGWLLWPERVLACVPALVATELALRALARLFLPAPQPAQARAATDSILASLPTGGARAPGTLIRTHLGLDFARSWALSFVARAALPALLLTALLCWGLSGLKLIESNSRGVYERFGAPVAVLGPGLHLLLPWPFGKLLPVEYGVIHSVAVGVGGASGARANAVQPLIGAEMTPPLSYNRLWASVHPDQAYYLVPSTGTGQLGFQSVDTEIFVLYKVGLDDRAALESLYAVRDPEELVRNVADRVVLRYFSSQTLEAVLGARVENLETQLRGQIAADIRTYNAGIDIVSVLVEEVHPPVGAAAAYHAVQAAQINSNASISDEVARAQRVAGVAQEERHQLLVAADASATETHDEALSAAYRFTADRRAFADGGQAFLFERYLGDLTRALEGRPLTILDSRLSAAQGPIIDMRPAAPASSGVVIPAQAAPPDED
jgi:regulator of protease activity HflC (stomatin/prohibitin superfamily)